MNTNANTSMSAASIAPAMHGPMTQVEADLNMWQSAYIAASETMTDAEVWQTAYIAALLA